MRCVGVFIVRVFVLMVLLLNQPRPISPMKVGPPRDVKPTSSTPARSASVRSRSSWAASASRHSLRPPERTSTGGQEDENWETLHDGLSINLESNVCFVV